MWKPPSPSDTTQGQAGAAPRSPTDDPATTTATAVSRTRNPGRRFAQVVRLKREYLGEYKACHAAVWPEVLKQIKDCGIEDYSIFYDDTTSLLFASFKYIGYDYAGDMERMAENAKVREWWRMTDGYQESIVPGAVSSEAGVPSWWKPMEEVFYQA